jgi:hypothetical protein
MKDRKLQHLIVSEMAMDAIRSIPGFVADESAPALADVTRRGRLNGIPVYSDPLLPIDKVLATYKLDDFLDLKHLDQEG